MLTVSKTTLPAFVSLVIAIISVSPAFGVGSSDCPFVNQGEEVHKVYEETFKEVTQTRCDSASNSQERGALLGNPAPEASREATRNMVFAPTSPFYGRITRVQSQGQPRGAFRVRSPADDVYYVRTDERSE